MLTYFQRHYFTEKYRNTSSIIGGLTDLAILLVMDSTIYPQVNPDEEEVIVAQIVRYNVLSTFRHS